ncbi:glycosyltransferase, group 2 family protein [Capnocytophaga sp. oral taxon 332 str. F0381]|jgi:glycosyltransferase, family 2|uniref:glycosyltransferase family 2 protein n=1 Tax=Capnocytophaga sp. oral taxon 332 TaxID=712213 RepID=UPI0002A43A54|nr:glycosyltransferase family 2 protein [Capnocytophaga sp. oral taxon 332]EKY07641.1 glycosyltransferase, group 2 family protein [Capnocytophaga sp. oral taxon 332 str. F0381]
MKVSIVTPTYNSAKTIVDTILSVNKQDYANIEHIIIDGGSKDNTLELIRNTPNRVKKIISEPDKGIYDAMNKGVALATGDIVGILNSDDFYNSNDVIAKVVKTFQEGEYEGVYGDLEYVDARNTNRVVRYWESKAYKEGLFKKGWHPAHPTFFVKKEVYDKYGNFNLKYKIGADYEIMLRFIEKNRIKVAYIPETLVKMRVGGASNQSIKNIIKANIECYNAWKDNGLSILPFVFILKPLSKTLQYLRK